MLAEPRRKGIYDRLTKADLMAFLAAAEPAGLVTATDVLNYLGPLPPVLAAVQRALLPGELFAGAPRRAGADPAAQFRAPLHLLYLSSDHPLSPIQFSGILLSNSAIGGQTC